MLTAATAIQENMHVHHPNDWKESGSNMDILQGTKSKSLNVPANFNAMIDAGAISTAAASNVEVKHKTKTTKSKMKKKGPFGRDVRMNIRYTCIHLHALNINIYLNLSFFCTKPSDKYDTVSSMTGAQKTDMVVRFDLLAF